MAKNNCPCAECVPPERQVGCHGWCNKYILWHKNEMERTEEERKERYLNLQITEMQVQGKIRTIKKHGRKK